MRSVRVPIGTPPGAVDAESGGAAPEVDAAVVHCEYVNGPGSEPSTQGAWPSLERPTG